MEYTPCMAGPYTAMTIVFFL